MPKSTTATRKRAFIQGIRAGKKVAQVCRDITIDRTLPYVWAEQDPTFAAEWEAARASRLQQLQDVAFESAMDGNTHLLKYLLGRFWRDDGGAPPVGEIQIIMPGGDSDGSQDFITIE
jgi:hypothetical protein